MSLAKIILIGNLGRDPETRYTPSGKLNVQFSMAVSRRFNDQSGQMQERTTWFRVTAWGQLAETMVKLAEQGALAKGRQVYVEGRIESREYTDQNNQQRTSLDVNATEFQLLGPRLDGTGGGEFAGRGAGGYGGSRGGDEFDAPPRGGGRPSRQDEDFGGQDIDEIPF